MMATQEELEQIEKLLRSNAAQKYWYAIDALKLIDSLKEENKELQKQIKVYKDAFESTQQLWLGQWKENPDEKQD
jgi:rubrerythrin